METMGKDEESCKKSQIRRALHIVEPTSESI